MPSREEKRNRTLPELTVVLGFLFLSLGGLTLWSLLQGPGYADESYFHWMAKSGSVSPGSAAPWYFFWCAGESLLILRAGCCVLLLAGDLILAIGVGCWLSRTGGGTLKRSLLLWFAIEVGRMLCNWTTPPYADYVTLNQAAASIGLGLFFAGSGCRGAMRAVCFLLAGAVGVQFLFFAPPGLILIFPVCWYFWGRRRWDPVCFLTGCLLGIACYFLLFDTPQAYWNRLWEAIAYYRTPSPYEHHNLKETALWGYWAFSGAIRCVLLPGCALFFLLRNKGKSSVERRLRWIFPLLLFLTYLPEFHAGLTRSWAGGLPATLLCAFALGVWLDYAGKREPGHRETILWWTLLWMPLLLSFGSDMPFLHRCRCYSGFALLAAVLAVLLAERRIVTRALALMLVIGGILAAFQLRVPLWSRKPETSVSLLQERSAWKDCGPDRLLRCTAPQRAIASALEPLAAGRKYLAGGKYLWHWRCRLKLKGVSPSYFAAVKAQPALLKSAGAKPSDVLFVDFRKNPLLTPEAEARFRRELGVKEFIRHRLPGPYDAVLFR